MQNMESEATTLWNDYVASRNAGTRDRIVEKHLPLVYHVARTIMRRLSGNVQLDDLVNAGCIGLLGAIDTYEPERGLAFSTFAVPRIRGAIIDDLRRSDIAARTVRKRQRLIARAEREVAAEQDGEVSARQTAERMQIDLETLHRWKSAARRASQVSLDQPTRNAEGEGPTIGELIAGASGDEVDERIGFDEERLAMRREFLKLGDRERIVLMLYYYDELKLRQIAEVLGITESRVSQIRTKALKTLRTRMRHLREED